MSLISVQMYRPILFCPQMSLCYIPVSGLSVDNVMYLVANDKLLGRITNVTLKQKYVK